MTKKITQTCGSENKNFQKNQLFNTKLLHIRQERACGDFVRSFTLPYDVEHKAIQAQYKNGVLLVKLPQTEASKPRKIAVSLD